jgi:DNA-directed RNA polymerase specialized sigma24 family protein
MSGEASWDETAELLGYPDGQHLRQAVQNLPGRQRQAVTLHEGGLTELETAAQLRISAGAVRAHLRAAYEALRRLPG